MNCDAIEDLRPLCRFAVSEPCDPNLCSLGSDACEGGLTAIAAVVSGAAAAITAWSSEQSPDRKLNRYTTAIISIKNLIR